MAKMKFNFAYNNKVGIVSILEKNLILNWKDYSSATSLRSSSSKEQ